MTPGLLNGWYDRIASVSNVYVDYRSSLSLTGSVIKYLALAPLLPTICALYYGENPVPFLVTTAVMAGVGFGLERLRDEPELGHREGFLLVSMTWLIIPILGTVPYLVAGEGTVAYPVNALFESMSGFTTTGSTLLGEISFSRHSHAMLLWRQLTQWLGGMGILVLMVALLPQLSVGGAQIISHESPGLSIEKLSPHIQDTARALWKIYLGFTLLAVGAYYGLHLLGFAPNMGFYNAVSHALTTLPTGGFSPEARSIEAFSPAIQWTVIVFMIIAGTNFTLFWYVLQNNPEKLTHNSEFRSYTSIMAIIGAVLTILLFTGIGLSQIPTNIPTLVGDGENAVRQALFQTAAIITTTGYASMDFNTWDESAQLILIFAMFLGGSAGSAAGSIKIVRWNLVWKAMVNELFTTVHPEAVHPIRGSGGVIDEDTLRSVFIFMFVFFGIFAVSTIIIYLDSLRVGLELTALEAISAVVATLGNVGPGVGIVGPMNNYLPFSRFSKLYMTFLMWIGRLEILSVIVIFTPSYWSR